MESFATGMLATLGIGLIVLTVISIIISIVGIVAAIILLCLAIKEKGELKLKGIDEERIKRIVTLGIWSLVATIISCSGCTFMVLPILALVFASSNAKNALQAGNVVEAVKKADLALIFLIISNVVILGLSALNTLTSIISTTFNVD